MPVKDDNWDELYFFAKTLADRDLSFNEIEEQLGKKTSEQDVVSEIMAQIKRVRYAAKRNSGLIKIGIGAFLLFLGFFITCINFHSERSFTVFMYSFTSIGLCVLFFGLYEVIG